MLANEEDTVIPKVSHVLTKLCTLLCPHVSPHML